MNYKSLRERKHTDALIAAGFCVSPGQQAEVLRHERTNNE